MTPSETHQFIAIIPMNIEDLSGNVSEDELKNVVYQEVVNNIEQHKDQIYIMRNDNEQPEKAK